MRRIICAGAICGGMLLCGCGGQIPFVSEKLPDMSGGFSSSAEVTFGKLTAQAEISRIQTGSWEFAFTAPEELAGVVMTIEDGKLSAELGKITVDAEGGEYTPLPLIIAGGIDGLEELSADDFTEKDGVLTAHSRYGDSVCTVTVSKSTGEILSLKSSADKLAVYFSDITPYTEEVGLIE